MSFLGVDTLNAMANEIADLSSRSSYANPRKYSRCRRLQRELALNFGRIHGWTLSSTPIALKQLADGAKNRNLNNCFGGRDHWLTDHGYGYREPNGSGRPVAIAAHLYGVDLKAVQEASERLNLRAEIITDYPSWWLPGATTLVLWTRAGGSK